MNIQTDWETIRAHFRQSFRSTLHAAIASVDEDHNPTVTPIGSLFLNRGQTGFYFEKFATKLPRNARSNKRVCILVVDANKWFWFKSLFTGKFKRSPAIKLYGELGELRKANDKEMSRFYRKFGMAKWLKGGRYLWQDMQMVREINFTKAESIRLGTMVMGEEGIESREQRTENRE